MDRAIYILCGGKSLRMGRDKALLEFAGTTLVARAVHTAQAVTDRVTLVGNNPALAPFGNLIPDVHPGYGPLSGIHAALAHSAAELNLMLGVDMPFVTARLLEWLFAKASAAPPPVSVPEAQGRLQPLCAVYRTAFLPVADQALRTGRLRLDRLLVESGAHVISEAELSEFAFDSAMFDNLNTPQDYERARIRER